MKGMVNSMYKFPIGAIIESFRLPTLEAVKKGIEKSVPARKQHLVEPNFRAIELGMSL